ncbi:MAG: aspartate--tRNA(Asn) ligase [Parcubacteria group bacterium CG07_land_8_20_14_0_80_35_11]|nr:MAG: aspartate--tRNA(Asn) ligase [Parcubacteria group bacterium CG07_land_8_20_14_0_80_35_11]
MKRLLVKLTPKAIGRKIKVCGWINSRRDHGKLIFINLRDRSGILQVVFRLADSNQQLATISQKLRPEWVVCIEGEVKERPKGAENPEVETGKIEIIAEKLEILAMVKKEMPLDLSKKELKMKLSTLLKERVLTLRHEKSRAIFRVFETVLGAYRKVMKKLDFVEIKTPKIIGTASEGGANFFTFDYFGKKAFLAQSPQFYKQIGVGMFERVFEIGPVFRKEPHFTTRHLNEYISLDAEMGFIENFNEIMDELEKVIKFILKSIWKENKKDLKLFSAEPPKIPKRIPRIKLREIRKIIKEKYQYEIPEDSDIDPKGEELAGKWAREKWKSDLVFLTHYPKSCRPFYTMPDKENPEETLSFDLLFKGVEIATGSQRIHKAEELIKNIKEFKLNPKDFKFYIDTFKYGMPPHGGWALGCERIVYKILNLPTIKEATLFPRDVKRLVP